VAGIEPAVVAAAEAVERSAFDHGGLRKREERVAPTA
jgi:hypothetical protein